MKIQRIGWVLSRVRSGEIQLYDEMACEWVPVRAFAGCLPRNEEPRGFGPGITGHRITITITIEGLGDTSGSR